VYSASFSFDAVINQSSAETRLKQKPRLGHSAEDADAIAMFDMEETQKLGEEEDEIEEDEIRHFK
jgi:hypothetical protein